MQPRLTRSRTDSMIAGVCGGLGEYFAVDPVIVRFIFVIVTLTSGLGLPVYLVLWLIMPKDTAATGWQQNSGQAAQLGQQVGHEAVQFGQTAHEVLVAQQRAQVQQRVGAAGQQLPPEPTSYNYDPLTGKPLRPDAPSFGQTINLGSDPQQIQTYVPQITPPATQPQRRKGQNWRSLGISLIIVGGLIFLNQLDINLDFVFPLVLIVAGLVLLRRK